VLPEDPAAQHHEAQQRRGEVREDENSKLYGARCSRDGQM